ncbi:MAG: valine--tRNA ligase [Flavobacteriales bacterium]|nr:MAG: valine--tRNA ligase [Flavobacteriales bacterium]
MSIAKTYDPKIAEDKWYKHWLEKGYFSSIPDDREPFTIVIPPPNVTGVLHMGHMLNNTIQDVLIRRARMQGKNACWVPGTDHASIATEAKVVQKLRSEGLKKSDLSRDEFLEHAFEWKEKHGGIILEQLKKLGASCDWNRTHFTMDEEYSKSVKSVFIDLFNKGKIYRGVRMVNWDPEALTAVSDEEVLHKEVNSKLFYIRYKVVDSDDQWLTIATTRPETIFGDTAICVNPNDERYKQLHGKEIIVPICNRKVPVVCDDYVDSEFGTGCLKVTPAHDINDYEIGVKHNLESLNVFNDNGTLNGFGLHYEGQDRFEVRKNIENELNEKGYLVKVEDHQNKVGFSERTNAIIEPKLSLQWFVNMQEMSKPALDNVINGNIKFHPEKFKNTYRHWMENIKDWCISRQLWWGHRIPAYYFGKGANDFVVAENIDQALDLARKKSKKELSASDLWQDEDVLDTWFSSWLWPISVFNGLTRPDNEEIKYYYPTNDLVTAPEIMFFWVARMIIAGYEYLDELPFKNVYFTGIVRDKLGRKMSKSLGNSPDPIELIHKYGADGVRVGILISSPAGNDLPFDTSQCEQGRNFANKIWNAFRLVSNWDVRDMEQPESSIVAIRWFENKLQKTLEDIDQMYDQYRISEALMATYKLVWDDFCSWYLEIVKPGYKQPIDHNTLSQTKAFFDTILKMLHPFMPFVSEELWHLISKKDVDLVVSDWPEYRGYDEQELKDFELSMEVISSVRNVRKEQNIASKVKLALFYANDFNRNESHDSMIQKMANLSLFESTEKKINNSNGFIVSGVEFFVPFGDSIDVEAERQKIEQELDYSRGFLTSVQKKLSNERFVNSAPKNIVDMERKKESDALTKIALLEEKLNTLV